jgi:tetratricopeptide (TPR) repeat protein
VVLLTWAASSAWAIQRLDEAKAYGEEAIALADDPRFDAFVWAYTDLAMIAAFQGDPAKALALLRMGAAHAADAADRFCLAFLHYSQGPFLQGEEAAAAIADALFAAKAAAFPSSASMLTAGAGRALAEKDHEAAFAALQDAIGIARACGNRTFESLIYSDIAALQARRGDPVEALKTFLELLLLWRGASELMIVAAGLGNLIVLLDRLGYSLAAATLFGHLAKGMEFGLVAPELAAAGAHLRTVLDPSAFDAASQRGSAMKLEDAVAFAEGQVRQALAGRSGAAA